MKKIIFFSGIVALLATPVLAGIKMPDVNVTGEIRAKGVKTNNTTDFKNTGTGTVPANADEDSIGKTRVRLNMNSKLSDGITAYINLQYGDSLWGNAGANGPNLTTIEGATQVRHAYLTIDNILGDTLPADINLTLGRQGIGTIYRELVLYTDSINAKVAKATYNDLTVTGICALENESIIVNMGATFIGSDTYTLATATTDAKIQGLLASYPLPVVGNITGYYLRSITDNPVEAYIDKKNVLGIKVEGSMEVASTLNWFFEYAMQSGNYVTPDFMQSGTLTTPGTFSMKEIKRDASALRIGGGYKTELASLGAVAVEGSYLSMSGDDITTNKNEKFTGIVSNYNYFSAMAVEGVLKPSVTGNVKALNLNASISPDAIEGVTLGFGYTKLTAAKVASGAKDDIGSEIDLTCGYKYNDKTNIDLTYARFSPGDASLTTMQDSASMLKCQLVTKF
ncbi:MAG: alginate export family protein [bacterium]